MERCGGPARCYAADLTRYRQSLQRPNAALTQRRHQFKAIKQGTTTD